MKTSYKIGTALAFALAAVTGAGNAQASISPASVEIGGIKSILRTQAAPSALLGIEQEPSEKLQQFAGNSSSNSNSNSSSNSNSNSSSNSNSNSSSNSNSNSSSNSNSNSSSNSNSNSSSNSNSNSSSNSNSNSSGDWRRWRWRW